METLYYPDAGEGGGRYIHIHLVYILWLWQIGDHNETDAVFSTTYTSAAVPFNPCFLVAQMLNFASRITKKSGTKNFRFQDLKNVAGIFLGFSTNLKRFGDEKSPVASMAAMNSPSIFALASPLPNWFRGSKDTGGRIKSTRGGIQVQRLLFRSLPKCLATSLLMRHSFEQVNWPPNEGMIKITSALLGCFLPAKGCGSDLGIT